jgi:predicted RNA binding protein YcfA (HicA-like mRNA interferase family)
MGKVDETIKILQQRSASMNGDELEKMLLKLGFEVRAGANGKHCVATHDKLEGFFSTSFDKGHGKEMKSVYVKSICKVLVDYRQELEVATGEKNE